MKRNDKKHSLLFAVPALAALVFGSIGITSAFAENTITDFIPQDVSSAKTDTFATITDVTPDRRAEVHFYGSTNGWAIIAGKAYDSEIALDGNAVRNENGVWKIKSLADISVEGREAALELKGTAIDGKLRLHGTGTLNDGDSFRIILRGHYAPIHDQPGDFVVDWSMAKIQNLENGFRIPLSQNGIIHVEPVIPVDEVADLETDLNLEE